MTTENLGPSKIIVDFLKQRVADGRIYNPTRVIADGTGLSRKVIGTRMKMMASDDWHGLLISKWSDKVWCVTRREKNAQRRIRADIQGL